jgi:hypothetical protein
MTIITPQQIIDERISFLREQINPNNKPQANSSFRIQISAIRSVDDDNMEKVEAIIKQKKAQLKNSKDAHESERLFAELDGLE